MQTNKSKIFSPFGQIAERQHSESDQSMRILLPYRLRHFPDPRLEYFLRTPPQFIKSNILDKIKIIKSLIRNPIHSTTRCDSRFIHQIETKDGRTIPHRRRNIFPE